jgi:hypothetical protein
MSRDEPSPTLEVRVRTLRIITAAMVCGAVTAFLILYVVRAQNPQPPRDPPLISYVALGVAVVMAGAAFVVPNLVAAAARRRLAGSAPEQDPAPDPGGWYGLYASCLILRLALLEGPAYFLLLAWFVEGWPVPLLMAAASRALMVAQFPSAERVERWVEAQKELTYQDRALS